MANTDYASQLTQIYIKLSNIDSLLTKLSLMSDVNTIQVSLSNSLNIIASNLSTLMDEVNNLKLNMADLLNDLRSQ